MEPGGEALSEAFVVGRMIFDDVEPPALAIMGLEARRVLVGEPAAIEGLAAAECGAEIVEGR